ncbi:O-fucosyltransferase 29-like isoform X1 [Triticum dicoccoides]|uniref:O-fucosyltransferase 29-like isoform X1 n=1 Tax=Triticum dicoccoides TaxID=85692 RepID=UPI00188E9C66|nr:O-fucosyltransferase 29-like isoform X1 [Triticum dicoccoides]
MGRKPDPAKPHYGGGSASPKTARRAQPSPVFLGTALFVLGFVSLFTGHIVTDADWSRIRSRWRSNQVRNTEPIDIWTSRYSNLYYGCSGRSPKLRSAVPENSSTGYLLIATSGGLNQQRIGITDAVVVAWILNATLVVPELDHRSFWKDDSEFSDIFDTDWFISYLSKDVTVVKRIPYEVMISMDKLPWTMRAPRKSMPEFYIDEVLPILMRRRALQLTKFDYRLTNDLDEELQKLRCRVNFHALRFKKPIQTLGKKLVRRLRVMSSRYVAIHLRFEPDMLAFSGCYYGGGEKERKELAEIRKRWDTLPQDLSAEDERTRGKCPLTPHEIGLMLRALGFGNETYLYVASGEIYGGEETLRPLRELFPNFYTKEMLAGDDLKPFLPFSSRLAAVDFIVCDESDVFVTNNNGNMAKVLAGRRRYMGHKRTIRPNTKKLNVLFQTRNQTGWDTFSRKVKKIQRGLMEEPDDPRHGRDDFHEMPSSCICQRVPVNRSATIQTRNLLSQVR